MSVLQNVVPKQLAFRYSVKVAKCLHLINFEDASEPYFKRPLTSSDRELFNVFISHLLMSDWKEIPNHHQVPTPLTNSQTRHSTFFLKKNNLWKTPTSLTVLAEDYPRYGRYCTEYTEHDARFLYFVETKIDVFHTPIFARQDLTVLIRFSFLFDRRLIKGNEKRIEINQEKEDHRRELLKLDKFLRCKPLSKMF
jgi:hypothetical protein